MNHIYFYYCEKFEKKIQGHTSEGILRSKLQELTRRRELGNRDVFRGGIYVLRTGNVRTIIHTQILEIEEQEQTIYLVREVIDEDTWSRAVYTQVKNGKWLGNNILSDRETEQAKKEFILQQNKENAPRQPPPSSLIDWHKEFNIKLGLDIYETESWVQFATNTSEAQGLREKDIGFFRNNLLDLIIREAFPVEKIEILFEKEGKQIKCVQQQNVAIVYTEVWENGRKYYLLYHGVNTVVQNELWEEIKQNITTLQIPHNLEEMRRLALRAYPGYVLAPAQKELWDKIQRSSENSNYSLLREQIEFLEGFSFPSYINGQAGSGKSTMLYYLFSNAYLFKYLSLIKGDIIFLTENETLLESTKISIRDLLTQNPEFDLNEITDFEDFDRCFSSFKSFLVDLLPEEDKGDFPESKYLNFSVFKKLYEASELPKHIIKKYSAEETWFAITTYIYGYKEELQINAENYEIEVDRDSRVLPKEKIAAIQENVLPFYNNLRDQKGYWDKLKIIQHIQENIDTEGKYALVICDEAQDFCRVELRFILRLNELMQYDLSGITQVPVVFAGDPNQTVNPTGFRVDEMKNILYEELKEIAGFNLELSRDKVIYHPSYNYRSSQHIVHLANWVQYYRKKHFNSKIDKPQEAKQSATIQDDYYQNVFLSLDTVEERAELREKLRYKAFILPVDTQEKEEYQTTQELFLQIEEADVKTSVEAKGAEYVQVVLYGFGDYFLERFEKLHLHSEQEDTGFEQRYFFNKLYVGITRAKSELIIIDSTRAKENFWKKLVPENAEGMYGRWEALKNYQDVILYDADTVNVLESSPDTALENAREDKRQGKLEENPNRLKMAAKQFFRLGEYEEQYICLALAEEIQGNWKEAAEYYAKTKEGIEKSEECYWKGKHLTELVTNKSSGKRTEKQVLRLALTRLLIHADAVTNPAILKEIYQYKHLLRSLVEELSWRAALIENLIQLATSLQIIEQVRRFAEILLEIVETEDRILYETIGNLFFTIDEVERAIHAWDKIDFFEERYISAKVMLAVNQANYIEEIIWRHKLLEYLSGEEQKQHEKVILQTYEKVVETKQEANKECLLAVYQVLLHQSSDKEKLLNIAQQVENSFVREVVSLKDFYYAILQQQKIDKTLWGFVLERWAKYTSQSREKDWLTDLNNKYKSFAQSYKMPYQAFEEEEIQAIESVPSHILQEPSPHFKNIAIRGFRRFEQLEINNLGQFNLIVGDNNTGKTSLLEALLFTPDETVFAKRLACSHAERSQDFNFGKFKKDFWEGFVSKEQEEKLLRFVLQERRNTWNYEFPGEDLDIYIHSVKALNDKGSSIQNPLVPFGKGYEKFLAQSYFDNIHKTGKKARREFTENLRVFIPQIEEVIADSDEILIEEEGFDKGIPLYQYGEGANKLFRILVQMILQKGQRIMIDEIDSGIHFSRFELFWEVILKLAKKNNIQVFATTHNLECVEYFTKILKKESMQEYQNLSRTITLYQTKEGKVKARTRKFEAFREAMEEGYNIRGGE